jgi:alkylation response protein AidB-like acyl-CoA dehydrogenase
MGLHGSSTTPLILQDVHVPAGQPARRDRQGAQGRVQRAELRPVQAGAMCSGGGATAIAEARSTPPSAGSSGGRSRFRRDPHKLGEMTARLRRRKHAVPRGGALIDAAIDGSDDSSAVLAALEEFAVEASIVKVAGSEMLDFVLDENVQIHGGNGFVRDYPAERHYRDARVNRIFEGTNEINRLLIPGMLARRSSPRRRRCSRSCSHHRRCPPCRRSAWPPSATSSRA